MDGIVRIEFEGPRDAIREAYRVGLIEDGEAWMDTIKARNITLHVYDESMVEEILEVKVEDGQRSLQKQIDDLRTLMLWGFNKLKETFEKIERDEDPKKDLPEHILKKILDVLKRRET